MLCFAKNQWKNTNSQLVDQFGLTEIKVKQTPFIALDMQ